MLLAPPSNRWRTRYVIYRARPPSNRHATHSAWDGFVKDSPNKQVRHWMATSERSIRRRLRDEIAATILPTRSITSESVFIHLKRGVRL